MRTLLLAAAFCLMSGTAFAAPTWVSCNAEAVRGEGSVTLALGIDDDAHSVAARVNGETLQDDHPEIRPSAIQTDLYWNEWIPWRRYRYRHHILKIDRVTGTLAIYVRRFSGAGDNILAYRGSCERSATTRF